MFVLVAYEWAAGERLAWGVAGWLAVDVERVTKKLLGGGLFINTGLSQ